CRGSVSHVSNQNMRGLIIAFSEKRGLPACTTCGASQYIRRTEIYPEHAPAKFMYEVLNAVRLHPPDLVDRDHYDPFIFEMKPIGESILDERRGKKVLWFPYWTYNRKSKWHWGGYPAAVTEDRLK